MSRRDQDDWQLQRSMALVRDGGLCKAADYGLDTPCQPFPPGPVVHHRNRRKGDDPHALVWLVTLCGFHHDWVHANIAESYALGLLVHSGAVEVGLKRQHRALVKSQVADTESETAA